MSDWRIKRFGCHSNKWQTFMVLHVLMSWNILNISMKRANLMKMQHVGNSDTFEWKVREISRCGLHEFYYQHLMSFNICLSEALGRRDLKWAKSRSKDSSGVRGHWQDSRPCSCSGVVNKAQPQPYSRPCLSVG